MANRRNVRGRFCVRPELNLITNYLGRLYVCPRLYAITIGAWLTACKTSVPAKIKGYVLWDNFYCVL